MNREDAGDTATTPLMPATRTKSSDAITIRAPPSSANMTTIPTAMPTAMPTTMPLHRSRSAATSTIARSRNNITTRRTMLHLSPLLLLLQLLSTAPTATAQLVDGECSCSPRQFFFKLDLSASCPALPPPFPPNDVFGAGVKDYTCTIGEEPIPNAQQPVTSDDGGVPLVLDEEDGSTRSTDGDGSVRRRRHLQSAPRVPESPRTAADYFPELIDELAIEELEWSSANIIASQNFTASQVSTNDDTVPVSIYSIQFLEVDTSFNVINQDSTYVRGIDFTTGDVFNYTSISKKSEGVVPGGMNMVLRGVNAEGQPVRNVFTITYTNSCDVATFESGEAIGWIIFENFEPASEETCNAPKITSAPATPPPITPFPTQDPDDTTAPTSKPTREPITGPPITDFPTPGPDETTAPTKQPTPKPTNRPTKQPTKNPTSKPTREPSDADTPFPTPGMTTPTSPTTPPPTTNKPTRDPSDTSPSKKPTPKPTKMPSHMSMPPYHLWSKSAKAKSSKSSSHSSKTISKTSKASSKSSSKSSKSDSKSSKAGGHITSSSSNDKYSEVPIINAPPSSSSSSRSAKTAKGRNGRNAEPIRDLEGRGLQGRGHDNNQQHLRGVDKAFLTNVMFEQVLEEMELNDHEEGREHRVVRNRRHLRR
eukprot:CAMPEP_0201868272 /NCGR_PEP_ID=MMETSP0902-20130614/2228_1 /ASSEMBLY_ACC=CAM_ASM_000551 /TAXON_ID=420261 /ORGANISM="Thalassiosira antarctica, Strain CCMP982" /LENGTH=649 /DNA_ID=CAMNT_0048393599 /DNA_START=310 /DNA_END=2259 /DNA_ORIENTATION=-